MRYGGSPDYSARRLVAGAFTKRKVSGYTFNQNYYFEKNIALKNFKPPYLDIVILAL